MKGVNNQLSRIENIVKKDEYSCTEKFIEMFNYDITKLIKNYFDIGSAPTIKIQKHSINILVELSFEAQSIKSFNSL